MKHEISVTLRLIWLPAESRESRRGFEVVSQSAFWALSGCIPMDLWHKYVPQPDVSGIELLIVTDAEEPSPLPRDTEFLLMVTHDNGEPGTGREAFYDWHALDFDSAQLFCRQEYGQDLATLVHAARELVQLPAAGAAH